MVGAIGAKSFSFSQTRELLVNQSNAMSEALVELISTHPGAMLPKSPNQAFHIYGWRADKLVVQQGELAIEKPSTTDTHIQSFNDEKWILSSSCVGANCVVVAIRDQERKHMVRRIVGAIFLGILVITAIALLALYYAVISSLKPLDALTSELSENDVARLRTLVGHDNVRELQPLVRALNQLTEKMRSQLEKERRFLDTCAHELRTPIAGLVAQIQSHATRSIPCQEQHAILVAAERTMRIANQFLSLARSENTSSLASQNATFDLPELVRQLSIDTMIQHKHASCQLAGLSMLSIVADPMAIEVVIRNLLDNACRHAGATATQDVLISVTITQRATITTLVVEDNGDGVSEAELHKLSRRFFRASQSGTINKQARGAGLGLSITKEVVKTYGGELHFKLSQPSGGLCVTATFKNIMSGL